MIRLDEFEDSGVEYTILTFNRIKNKNPKEIVAIVNRRNELKRNMLRIIAHELLRIITFPSNRVSQDYIRPGIMHPYKEG